MDKEELRKKRVENMAKARAARKTKPALSPLEPKEPAVEVTSPIVSHGDNHGEIPGEKPKAEGVSIPTTPQPVLNKAFDRNIFRLFGGALLLLVGGLLGYLWFTFMPQNIVAAALTLLSIGGGIFFIIKYFNSRGMSSEIVVFPSGQAKVGKKQVNSLCIYPDRVEFVDVDKPLGQPWRCLNDGKYYFVHIFDEGKKELKVFSLPDQQYMDPGIFAKRVLELPAHRRIFRRKQSLLEQLSPAMALIGIVVFGIVMIVTLG